MRIKLEFAEKFAHAKGVSRVWFDVSPDSMPTIRACAEAIGRTFGFETDDFEIELDGFLLLGGQSTLSMLREDCILRVVRASSSLWSPLKTLQWQAKSKPSKSEQFRAAPTPLRIESFSSESSSSSSSSSSTSSSSSSSSTTTTSSSSSESSVSVKPAPVKVKQAVIVPEAPTYSGKSKRKRMNKRNRLAMQKASGDTLTNLSRFYRNQMDVSEDNSSSTTKDYESLPKVSLEDIQIGQVVAWRELVLSPDFTASFSPFQERQLVSISPQGLQFRIVSPETYLASWWYNEDGEKVCTVREWLETNGSTLEPEITLPLDASQVPDDLRLLHNADIV